jgi:hypothetical protein
MNERVRISTNVWGDRKVLTNKNLESLPETYRDYTIFDKDTLLNFASAYDHTYRMAEPFPHASLKNVIPWEIMDEIHRDFPSETELDFEQLSEGNLLLSKPTLFPDSVGFLIKEMSSPLFLTFLENLSGIKGLIPDPHFEGAGLNICKRGSLIDLYQDSNIHSKLGLHKRVKIVLFLNKDWNPKWGGELELWAKDKGEPVKSIVPEFNRFICMSNSERCRYASLNQVNCPSGHVKKFISIYYYSAEPPED